MHAVGNLRLRNMIIKDKWI